MTAFQRLLLVTCLITYSLIVLGAVVRATGSGLGCPDWPRCHGQLVPPFEREVLIEYSHRLVAALATPLILATAFLAWRSHRHIPIVPAGATLAAILLLTQVLIGGITVLFELPETIVTVHLGTALALLGILLVIAVATFTLPSSGFDRPPERNGGAEMRSVMSRLSQPVSTHRSRRGSSVSGLALVTVLATYLLMLTGAYVRASGASLGCLDWPLCNGEALPVEYHLAAVHMGHRLTAAVVGILISVTAVSVVRTPGLSQAARISAALALPLYVVQVLVGAANVWTRLAPELMATHVALASLLWADLVITAALTIDLGCFRFSWVAARLPSARRWRIEPGGGEERGTG